jgi:hypothetical protein
VGAKSQKINIQKLELLVACGILALILVEILKWQKSKGRN